MVENLDWIAIAQRGFEAWKAKPHNARWFRKIDGTPIPNDLTICIGQAFADELARRSPPPAVEGGWREIATAPKDGTRFLTFDDYYGVRMGRAFIRADHDDWLSYVDCNGNSSKGGIRATHWQPLPTPPAGEKP